MIHNPVNKLISPGTFESILTVLSFFLHKGSLARKQLQNGLQMISKWPSSRDGSQQTCWGWGGGVGWGAGIKCRLLNPDLFILKAGLTLSCPFSLRGEILWHPHWRKFCSSPTVHSLSALSPSRILKLGLFWDELTWPRPGGRADASGCKM